MSVPASQSHQQDQEPQRSRSQRGRAHLRRKEAFSRLSGKPGRPSADPAMAFESNLSNRIEITTEELDAIARLLGDELKAFLSGN